MQIITSIDAAPVFLSLKLAAVTTLVLLAIGLPLAWWLARTESRRMKAVVSSVVMMPLVLPPSVLGFYMLVAMGPNGPVGVLTEFMGISSLNFTFTGLVVGSVVYSCPFMLQPLTTAFEAVGRRPMEVAATLGYAPTAAFIRVMLPLAKHGVLSGIVMTFAHTIGEFGVVLMIGGNIPGQTQVISTEIFTFVEAMEYDKAHVLAGGMLLFSFITLLMLNVLGKRRGK